MITDYNSEEGRRLTASSLSSVEICVQDMLEAGFTDLEIATALGCKMLERLERGLPYPDVRKVWLAALCSGA